MKTSPTTQTKDAKSPSQQNISNQVCSVCWFRHYFAKTSKQQGNVVIKETTLQQEDAVIRPSPVAKHLPCCHVSLNNNLSTQGGSVLFETEGALPLPQTRSEELRRF